METIFQGHMQKKMKHCKNVLAVLTFIQNIFVDARDAGHHLTHWIYNFLQKHVQTSAHAIAPRPRPK